MHLLKAVQLLEYVESSHEEPYTLFSCYISTYCKQKMLVNVRVFYQDEKLRRNKVPAR